MRITYDPEADAIYIELKEGKPGNTKTLEDGVHLDLDADNHLMGIEFLYARSRYGDRNVGTVIYQNLALTMPDEDECGPE